MHPKHLQTLCSTAGAAGACAVDGCFDHDVQRKDVTPGGVLPVGDQAGLTQGLPGLVNIQKTMERSTIVNGKIHYFYGFFTIISYVCLPEGTYSNYFKLWFESKRQFKLVWERKKTHALNCLEHVDFRDFPTFHRTKVYSCTFFDPICWGEKS